MHISNARLEININSNMCVKKSLEEIISIIPRKIFRDERGWFLKMLTGKEEGLPSFTGEVYGTSATFGQAKGGHYHEVAKEWFTLIKGKATLRLKDVRTDESMTIHLSFDQPVTVVVPPYVAHIFENESVEDYILIAYTDLLYDPKDTIIYTTF
jgi:dTDP-4-dehydrorhamnose 3,5-epimerase-like enzyme